MLRRDKLETVLADSFKVKTNTYQAECFTFVRNNSLLSFNLYPHPSSCSEMTLVSNMGDMVDDFEFVKNLHKLRAANITRLTWKRKVYPNQDARPISNWKLVSSLPSVYSGHDPAAVECYELILGEENAK